MEIIVLHDSDPRWFSSEWPWFDPVNERYYTDKGEFSPGQESEFDIIQGIK